MERILLGLILSLGNIQSQDIDCIRCICVTCMVLDVPSSAVGKRRNIKIKRLGLFNNQLKCTAWPSRPREAHRTSRWMDSWDKQQRGWKCGYILCTGMSWTPWSFYRRETSPTHGALDATCLSPGVYLMEGTLPPHSAPGERSVIEGG